MRKILQITNSLEAAIKFVVKHKDKWITANELAKAIKCAQRTARMYLEFMAETGVLKRKKDYPSYLFKLGSKRKLNAFVKRTPRIAR